MPDEKKLEDFFKKHAGEDEKMDRREFKKMLKNATDCDNLKEIMKGVRKSCKGEVKIKDGLDFEEFKKVVEALEAKGVTLDLDACGQTSST